MLTDEQRKKLLFHNDDCVIRLSDEWILRHKADLEFKGIQISDLIGIQQNFYYGQIEKAFVFLQARKAPNDDLLYYYNSAIYGCYKPKLDYLEKVVNLFELLTLKENEKYRNYILDYDPAEIWGASAHSSIRPDIVKDNQISYTWNHNSTQGHMGYSESRFSGLIPYLYETGHRDLYERMLAVIENFFMDIPQIAAGMLVSLLNFANQHDDAGYERLLQVLEEGKKKHPEIQWNGIVKEALPGAFYDHDRMRMGHVGYMTMDQLIDKKMDVSASKKIPYADELGQYEDDIKNDLSKEWLESHCQELKLKGISENDVIAYQHHLIFKEIEKADNFLKNHNYENCRLISEFVSAVGGFYLPDRECLEKTVKLLCSLNEFPNERRYLFSTDPTLIYGPDFVNRLHTLIIKDKKLFKGNNSDNKEGYVTYAEGRFSGLLPYLFHNGYTDLYEKVIDTVIDCFAIVSRSFHFCGYPLYVCCMNFANQYDPERLEPMKRRMSEARYKSGIEDDKLEELMGFPYKDLKKEYQDKKTIEELLD